MQQNDRIEKLHQLIKVVMNYYSLHNRDALFLSSGLQGRGVDEGDFLYANFIIDKSYVIRYSIPTSIRTFAGLWLGVGPDFVPLEYLLETQGLLSGDDTVSAVEKNLGILDSYLKNK